MAKRRKAGQWKEVVTSRKNKERDLQQGRGLSNIPNIMDVGSAAYRRLMNKGAKRK